MPSTRLDRFRRAVIFAVMVALPACARQAPPPRVPPDLPHTLPSEEEASHVQPGAGEAIPIPPQPDTGGTIPASPQPDAGRTTSTSPQPADSTAGATPQVLSQPQVSQPRSDASQQQSDASSQQSDVRPQQLGFRVQIFASSDLAAAEALAARCRQTMTMPVYLETDGPLHRVRLGDFTTRAAAEAARNELAAHGHPHAFIVESLVFSR